MDSASEENGDNSTQTQLMNTDTYKIPRPGNNDNLAWDVIEIMWEKASFYEDERTYQKSVGPATKGQLAIYACTWYLAEVNNGGHHQFFFNGTGMVWEDALNGFALIGAEQHRKILARAVSQFPNGRPSKDRFARQAELESLDIDRFHSLDDELYGSDENIDALATTYILAHPDEFFLNR